MYAVYNGSMKKKLLILGVLFAAIPIIALAWDIGDPLVPCGTSKNSTSCNLCHLFVLGQNIVDFLTKVIAPSIAVLAFALAGFKILISGGSPGQRQEGMKIIRNTVIGLLIVFGAWIIINELLLFFAGGTTGTGEIAGLKMPWDTITCIAPLVTKEAVTPSVAYDKEGSERIALNAAGIAVKTNYCTTFDSPACCTTVATLNPSAITALINLKNNCGAGCNVTVSGGTERVCHTTHGPNTSIVDLRLDTVLNNYIQNTLAGGTWTPHTLGRLYAGIYLLEYKNNVPDHWHITF